MKRILALTVGCCTFLSIASAQYVNTNQSLLNNESLPPGDYQIWTFDNDGGISGISAIPEIQCASSVSPSIEITNFGINTLTSATIEYDLDGNALAPFYWSGNLAANQSETIMLPDITAAPGFHLLTVAVTVANGTADINNGNNNSIEFTVIGTPLPAPLSEGFENSFLPEGFFAVNLDNDETWLQFDGGGGYGESANSMQLVMYNTDGNEIDEFFIRNVDLSFLSNPVLAFDMAYALYNLWYQDKLKIWVSTDCGGSWSLVFYEDGETMQTTSPTTSEFYPSYKTWNTKTVSLSDYTGNNNVQIKFQGISEDGNNLYIDNISIGQNTGIHAPLLSSRNLILFPNPADEYCHLEVNYFSNHQFVYEIFNQLGQRITDLIPIAHQVTAVSTTSFNNGFYTVRAHSAEGQIFQSTLLVQH